MPQLPRKPPHTRNNLPIQKANYTKQKRKPIKKRIRYSQPDVLTNFQNCHPTNKPTNTHAHFFKQHTHRTRSTCYRSIHCQPSKNGKLWISSIKIIKRNFDIDTSFHVRNSQRILNLCTNPTAHPEPAL
ncbi:hypothetical protein FHG87_003678 [Trinorchestia longiramus]|nr:hypothetical protein FHG87_003678 [Trinorchestia longiramus]